MAHRLLYWRPPLREPQDTGKLSSISFLKENVQVLPDVWLCQRGKFVEEKA